MKILAALDFSGFTGPILAAVERIAAGSRAVGIWLLHVAEPDPSFVGYEAGPDVVRDQVAAEYRQQRQQLQGHAERLRRAGHEVTAQVVPGAIAETILAEAGRIQADLIVMGSHGYGTVADLLLGGVCRAVLRRAGCPVLVIPRNLAAATGRTTPPAHSRSDP